MSSQGYTPNEQTFGSGKDIKITTARQPEQSSGLPSSSHYPTPSGRLSGSPYPTPSGRLSGSPYPTPSGSLSGHKQTAAAAIQKSQIKFSNENNYSTKPAPSAQNIPQKENPSSYSSEELNKKKPSREVLPTSLKDMPLQESEQHKIQATAQPQIPPPSPPLNDVIMKYNELRREAERARKDINELKERLKSISSGGSCTDDFFGEIPKSSELKASLEELLKLQLENNGTTLLIKTGSPPMIRLEGELIPVGDARLTEKDTKRLILSLLSKDQRNLLAERKNINFPLENSIGRFNAGVFLQRNNISASFKAVKRAIRDIESIGFPQPLLQSIPLMTGLFIITGISGSGKSSTLASIIEFLNRNTKLNIITIEDPIEYIFEDKESTISQREVGQDTSTMEEGIISSLRQDPDLIVVGEIKNFKTAYNAIKAAEAGKLVIATFKASNAVHSILKLLNLFPASRRAEIGLMLSETLYTVLAQKMIPHADMEHNITLFEVLNVTPSVAPFIASGNYQEIYNAIQNGAEDGMVTFNKSIALKVAQGLLPKDAALLYSDDPGELTTIMAQMKI